MRRRLGSGIAGGVLAVAGMAFVAPAASAAQSYTLHVRLGLLNGTTGTDDEGNARLVEGQPCWGADSTADISRGTSAVVRNGKGSIIGSASLGRGVAANGACYFNIPIKVPSTSFYQLSIGSGHGSVTYTLAQLKRYKWKPPALGLGG